MRTLQGILQDMRRHTVQHPNHGYNCACKDTYIREARLILSAGTKQELYYLTDVLRRPT